LLMLPAVYFTLLHALSVGSLRYRIPAEVPMAVIAASALVRHQQPIGNGDGSFQQVDDAQL
jgi:hypothetical protein